jgi:hypothetical protein
VNRLEKCTGCARHIRVSEPACPFCGAAVPVAFGEADALARGRRGRIGRGAILAIGAASVGVAVAACSGGDGGVDEPNATVDYGTVVGMVDASTPGDASTDAAPPMGIASYGTVVGMAFDGGDASREDDGGDGGGDASHEDASFDGGDGGDAD